jgi:hypothetical protein
MISLVLTGHGWPRITNPPRRARFGGNPRYPAVESKNSQLVLMAWICLVGRCEAEKMKLFSYFPDKKEIFIIYQAKVPK